MRKMVDSDFQYMSTTEAAAELGCTEGRIRQLCIAKIIHGRKLGTVWAIPYLEIQRHKGVIPKVGRRRNAHKRRSTMGGRS